MTQQKEKIQKIKEFAKKHFPEFDFKNSTYNTGEKKLEKDGEFKTFEYLQISWIMQKYYPNNIFTKNAYNGAYNKLRKDGIDAVINYLKDPKLTKQPGNLQVPVKCNIVAASRPLNQWNAYRASENVQKFIYTLSKDEVTTHKKRLIGVRGKDRYNQWATENDIDLCGLGTGLIMTINKIFINTFQIYFGVEGKVNNKNTKKQIELKRENEWREENGRNLKDVEPLEKAYDENDKLLQPPGINHSIYTTKESKLKPYNKEYKIIPDCVILDTRDNLNANKKQLQEAYADAYNNYSRHSDDIIIPRVPLSRLNYVPSFQHDDLSVNKTRRMRKYWNTLSGKAEDSLLVCVQVGNDWAIIDIRGLLRDAYRRGFVNKDPKQNKLPTISKLLSLVTGDPVLDAKRNICTFSYKPEILGVVSKKIKKAGTKFTENLKNEKVNVIGIDLGVTNPIAAKIYPAENKQVQRDKGIKIHLENCRIRQYIKRNGESNQLLIEKSILEELKRFGQKWDKCRNELRELAVSRLPKKDRLIVRAKDAYESNNAKDVVCAYLKLNKVNINWDNMTGRTTFLSDMYLNNGGAEEDVFWDKPKRGSKENETIWTKRSDFEWSKKYKPKLSEELQQQLNEELWQIQRESNKYQKLSKYKKELLRYIVNYVIKSAEKETKGYNLIIAVEDLVTNKGMFDTKGNRNPGWNEFFKPKKSNPWYMKMLLTTFKELAQNHGYTIVTVNPYGTSQQCPKCSHTSKDNRDKNDRELFHCVECDYQGHADFDVATYNIAKIAITGQRIKKFKNNCK